VRFPLSKLNFWLDTSFLDISTGRRGNGLLQNFWDPCHYSPWTDLVCTEQRESLGRYSLAISGFFNLDAPYTYDFLSVRVNLCTNGKDVASPLEVFHGHLFLLAKYGKDYFLGILSTWIHLPSTSSMKPIFEALLRFQNALAGTFLHNHRGILLKNGSTFCFLPGYTGLLCDQKVSGFVSLWSLVSPFLSPLFAPLWQRVLHGNVYIFGVPWYALPNPLIRWARHNGLTNLSSHLSPLDVYFLAVLFAYLLSTMGLLAKKQRKTIPTTRHRSLRRSLVKALKKLTSVFLSPMVHHNVYDVFLTLLGIHIFAVPVSQVYDHLFLLRTYLLWIVVNLSLLLLGTEPCKGSFGFLSALGMLYSFTKRQELELLSIALLLHLLTRDLQGSLLGLSVGFGLRASFAKA
jgi:hypothetical protein